MMLNQSGWRPLQTLFTLLVLLGGGLLVSCGEKGQSPEAFYADLVKAARERNGGFMYDVLDSTRRASIDTLIGMQMANLDKLPPSERARWDSLKGASKRDIYARILTSDKGLSDIFNTDYKVLKAETLVVMKIQHTGQEPNTIYLHPKNGTYEIVEPPRSPIEGMPDGHPPMNEGQAPEGNIPQGSTPQGRTPPGGAPHGSVPQSGAPGGQQKGGGSVPK